MTECFVVNLSASQTDNLIGISRITINWYFNEIRLKMLAYSDNDVAFAETICEVDELYFGVKR